MNICRLTNNLNIGGVQKRLFTLLPLLAEEHKVTCITYKEKGYYYEKLPNLGVNTFFHPIKSKTNIKDIIKLKKKLQSHNTDIIHTHSLGANIPGILAGALAKTPVKIAQVHRKNYHWYAKNSIQRKKQICLESMVHRMFTDKILFVSKESLDYFQKKTKISNKKLKILHNGIEIPNHTTNKRKYRKELNIPPEKKAIAFIGRIGKGKGLDFFIDFALNALHHSSDFVFLVIGDGPEKKHYENIIAKAEKTGNIIFYGTQSNVSKFYESIDLLLFTSEPGAEGMSGVALEACSFKVPILARKTEPLTELKQYYNNITFINEEEKASSNIHRALEKRLNTYDKFINEFSLNNMHYKTIQLYNKLLSKKQQTKR